jgi:NAD(P)-dependent dehydrogenase (short-subunit alcohol dehydrogenase family)
MPTILVTGASRGIGLEVCAQLKARGDDVIAVCRTASPGLSALGVRVIAGVDVSDAESVNRLKTELAGQKLDVLINNAGILKTDSFGSLD